MTVHEQGVVERAGKRQERREPVRIGGKTAQVVRVVPEQRVTLRRSRPDLPDHQVGLHVRDLLAGAGEEGERFEGGLAEIVHAESTRLPEIEASLERR